MRKGFTLVEMLAVVLILGIILLIGVPIYQGVQKSTNESIYNSKISNVLTKAEEYSEEHGVFIYDIRKMISLGLLTPDNEAGEFRDPRDNRNMLCDVIQVTLENGMYYANVSTGYNDDGSVHCYSDDELKSMNSIVKINFYKERDGVEQFPSGWVKANHVYAGYEFIGSPEVSNVNVTWGGVGTQLDNGRLDIYTDSLMNAEVQLHIEFDYNGKHIIQDISKNVRIDNESPRGYVTTGPGTEKSNNLSYVEWQLTDGDGSGVAGHIILDEESFRSKPCESYTVDEIPGSDQTRVGKHLNNGVYYICAKDNVGNITRNSDAEENRVEVRNVDQSSGDIESFKIESRTPPYNLKEVKLITELKDETPSGYDMCMSHTGYLENCSWEEFNSSKDYTINGYDYGSEVEFYLSVRDSAGNVSNIASTYTIDNLQYLDLNGQLNGVNQDNIQSLGVCDVYINGRIDKSGVSDYYEKQVPGSTYEIKNCTSLSGFRYKGESSITGVISRSGTTGVYVPYVSLYTITYDMNGGSGSVASQTKEHGTNINLNGATTTRSGYVYGGWNTNAEGTGTSYEAGASYSGNGNVTLYVKWNPNTITTTLDNQSASNAGTAKVYYKYNLNTYYSNSAATTSISSITKPSKTGYEFQGYYTGTNGSGVQYINASGGFVNDLYKQVNNQTLNAYWKANIVSIALDKQSGTEGTDNIFYAYNTNAYFSNNTLATTLSGKISIPKKVGYTFKGYYSGKNGTGTQYVNASGVIVNDLYKAYVSNTTIYASWDINSYTVTWNANGGTCSKASSSHNYNSSLGTLPTCTRSGYNFLGWFTSTSGGTQVSASTTVSNAITYYAQWKQNNFTIIYNANGGTGTMANQSAANGTEVTLRTNTFTHSLKVFAGWSTTANGAVTYKDGAKITLTDNLTLYAVWKDTTMKMVGNNLVIDAKYYITNAPYTTFNASGGCGDHHDSYVAKIGLIYGGFTTNIVQKSPNNNSYYIVAGDKYRVSSKRLDRTYYMAGVSSSPDNTNLSFSSAGSGYLKTINMSNNTENTNVQYCADYALSTCVQVASKYSYQYDLKIISCNHNDLQSSTPRTCNLLITYQGTLENYDKTKAYPTGIGFLLDEFAEEGGGPGSDESHNSCRINSQHRGLSLS